MDLQQRIETAAKLGRYIKENNAEWQAVKDQASRANAWFTPEFIELLTMQVAERFLQPELLTEWAAAYQLPEHHTAPKKVGIVMAGNLPLVGFHDLLAVFISGHIAVIKPSSKDTVLMKHIADKLAEFDPAAGALIQFAEVLKGCDAYIATGSNNTGRYFEYYFSKYPHIIRRNRTSVAILTGNESQTDLLLLADDILLYFGLGCRNVTKIYVPENYDFVPLLAALKKHESLIELHKYKHNYDYQLTLLIMNNRPYMNNGFVVLTENSSLFPPISQLYYEQYTDSNAVIQTLEESSDVQCVVGEGFIPFGMAQQPSLTDYADGIDTMAFLKDL
jgi:hypothetical protein